jgi:hypothetical protein
MEDIVQGDPSITVTLGQHSFSCYQRHLLIKSEHSFIKTSLWDIIMHKIIPAAGIWLSGQSGRLARRRS